MLTLLQEYYRRFAYRNATSEDFIRTAEEISGQNLGSFFQDWLL